MICVHDLGDDGHARLLFSLEQKLDTFGSEALEVVRRCARLERAAAQDRRAGRLDALGDPEDLLGRLNRARAAISWK
jgi:hypothetical protein